MQRVHQFRCTDDVQFTSSHLKRDDRQIIRLAARVVNMCALESVPRSLTLPYVRIIRSALPEESDCVPDVGNPDKRIYPWWLFARNEFRSSPKQKEGSNDRCGEVVSELGIICHVCRLVDGMRLMSKKCS
jgi:hypothetical protein